MSPMLTKTCALPLPLASTGAVQRYKSSRADAGKIISTFKMALLVVISSSERLTSALESKF